MSRYALSVEIEAFSVALEGPGEGSWIRFSSIYKGKHVHIPFERKLGASVHKSTAA